jgi:hypothetical protein
MRLLKGYQKQPLGFESTGPEIEQNGERNVMSYWKLSE